MVADELNMEKVIAAIFLCHEDSEDVIFDILGRVDDLLLNGKLSFFDFIPRLLVLPRVGQLLLLDDSHGLVLEEGSH